MTSEITWTPARMHLPQVVSVGPDLNMGGAWRSQLRESECYISLEGKTHRGALLVVAVVVAVVIHKGLGRA